MNSRLCYGKSTCQVKHNDGRAAVLNVRWDKGMESFLTCGIPELHSEGFIIDVNGFGDEINSDSGLH